MFGNIRNLSVPGQLYHTNLNGAKTVLAEPAEQLSGDIFYYWLMHIETSRFDLEVIPDGALDLVVSPSIKEFSAVYPPVINKFVIPLQGPVIYAGVSFEPEAAQKYLAADLDVLSRLEPGVATTQALALENLVKKVQGVTDIEAIKAIFDQTLQAWNSPSAKRLKKSAYQCFIEELDATSTEKVAKKLGISARQFRRTVHDISGLPPKQMQRIVRLQQLLHKLYTSQNLEVEDGFYDDSHRIREVKELVGITYGELRKMAEIYNSSE